MLYVLLNIKEAYNLLINFLSLKLNNILLFLTSNYIKM